PRTTQSLEIPPDLTRPQIQDKYSIPAVAAGAANAAGQQVAAAADTAKTDKMRLERAGTERWLVVDGKTPAELWPVLKAFWQDNGFVIGKEDPDVGVMETDWAENRAKLPQDMLRNFLEKVGLGSAYSTGERDKFRIRLEKTAQGSEVYFSHRGMIEVYTNDTKGETRWQPRPVDPGLEAELLSRFMVRLGMTEEQARESVKKTIAAKEPTTLPIANGVLTINDGFDRAWRRVGLALDRVGLVVNDRDRSKGIYYVKPAKGETDAKSSSSGGGFWSSLAFWKSDDASPAKLPDNDLLVEVKETAPGTTTLRISDKDGKPVSNEFAKTALSRLATELQ
ncbi:outer membrane protein assembly factor BamC, partial [Paludibacterium paludis]